MHDEHAAGDKRTSQSKAKGIQRVYVRCDDTLRERERERRMNQYIQVEVS